MGGTNVFDYVNVLDKAADAAVLRNKAISNNLANIDTPGYKRQDVSFAAELEEALRHSRYETLDQKVGTVRLDRLRGRVYTDSANYSYRLDGNNVDIETENAELAKNSLMYNGISQSMKAEFQNLKAVIK